MCISLIIFSPGSVSTFFIVSLLILYVLLLLSYMVWSLLYITLYYLCTIVLHHCLHIWFCCCYGICWIPSAWFRYAVAWVLTYGIMCVGICGEFCVWIFVDSKILFSIIWIWSSCFYYIAGSLLV